MKNTENISFDALGTAKFFIQGKLNDKAKAVLDMVKPYCSTLEQYDMIGKLYADIREFETCLELALKIHSQVQTKQAQWDSRTNIVRAYLNLNQPENALRYIEINEKINPNDHPNQMDRAMAYFLLNRKDEAEQILRQILTQTHTEDVDFRVKFNLGTYDLAKGNFKEGLKGFLVDGRKLSIWESYMLPKERLWTGGGFPNKTILLCAEGGIGDEIISVRFHKHFKDMGMNPIWYTNRRDLAEIFKRNGFKVITSINQYNYDWLWCYSMTVPAYLDITEDDLWYGNYLTPIRKAEKLPGQFKIGIKTSGNSKYDQDLNRSVPSKQLIDALPKNATIYSFHVDEDIDDDRVVSLRSKIKSWDDTLDFMDQMDLIISSCTSTAHAASAMGKKTIVLVPILNYYVWAYPSKHSKWYSENTIVLRQQTYKNWNVPIEELKTLLDNEYDSK